MDMKKEDMEQIGKVLNTKRLGYALIYPCDGGERKKYMITTTPKKMAKRIESGCICVEMECAAATAVDLYTMRKVERL